MEYHKIETLYERDEHFKVIPGQLKNPVYSALNTWHWTEKIDGTNIRVIWNPNQFNDAGTERGNVSFGGKTDGAQIHADLVKWLYGNITVEKLRAVFPNAPVVLYGEGYGPGIQKGGGLYGTEKKFILFDVFVVDPLNSKMGGWWLNDDNVRDVASKLGLDAVPYVGEMTLEEATEMVRNGFQSRLNDSQRQAEGLVGRPIETMFDKKGHRMIVKLKTRDYA